MTLHEFLDAFCPEGPGQFRQLIRAKTGVYFPYSYVWRWCKRGRPKAVSVEHAAILHVATDGKCSMDELQNLRTIRERHGMAIPPRVKPHVRAKEVFEQTKTKFLHGDPGANVASSQPRAAKQSKAAPPAKRAAKSSAKPKVSKASQSRLLKRVAELERQLAAMHVSPAPASDSESDAQCAE